MISSWPVTNSNFSFPISGTLIAGKLFDRNEIDRLGKQIHLKIGFHGLRENLSGLQKEGLKRIIAKAPIAIVENQDQLIGFSMVTDIRGSGYLLLEINVERVILQHGKRTTYIMAAVLSCIILVLLLVLAAFLEKIVTKPIQVLSDHVSLIKDTKDLSTRLKPSSNDELGKLTAAFNSMSTKLEEQIEKYKKTNELLEQEMTNRAIIEGKQRTAQKRILEAQRLESLGQLAGGVAHDFNNLLTGIIGNVNMALMDLPPESEATESMRQIEKAANRAADLANQMLAYSGKGHFIVQPMNLSRIVNNTKSEFTSNLPTNVKLVCKLGERAVIEADTPQIIKLIESLVTNSAEAIGEDDGTITISTGFEHCNQDYLTANFPMNDLTEGAYAFLEISDTGRGMDEETISKVFDPFFSTKFTGRGLGLAAVQGIVNGHGGGVIVSGSPGNGASFKVLFPLSEKQPIEEETSAAKMAKLGQQNGTILVVDDEHSVLNVSRKSLERAGYKVFTATNGLEALEVFKEHITEIDGVVLDLTMPKIGGHEALVELKKLDPEVKVLVASGYSSGAVYEQFQDIKPLGLIQKPFTPIDLIEKVKRILES